VFLREAWYVAARSAEVTRRPLARTLLGLLAAMLAHEAAK